MLRLARGAVARRSRGDGRRRGGQSPSCSRTIRVTSPPSARPFVSRMTWPMITPDRLHVAAAQALGDVGVGRRARPRRSRRELVAAAERAEALGLDDRAGSPPSATSRSSTCSAGALGDLRLASTSADERGERRGRDLRLRRVGVVAQAGDELVGDPVGQRLRLGAVGVGASAVLEVVAELGAEGQQPRACRRSGRARARSARRARRAARAAPRGARRASPAVIATGIRSGSGK